MKRIEMIRDIDEDRFVNAVNDICRNESEYGYNVEDVDIQTLWDTGEECIIYVAVITYKE